MHHCNLPGTPEQNLAAVWSRILQQYEVQKTSNRFWSMKLTMFSDKGGCKLKGTAAEIRHFGEVLHPVWVSFMDSNKSIHRHLELCLRLGVQMETILDLYPGTDYAALPGMTMSQTRIVLKYVL